ncbi:antiviral RADAR system adenosine deaminase RdrB [Enterobacter mori]|jgi:adenosine deaminase|uniref:antiviral RADAR system adenosine deaminase RdrB n=1 Tax=Enterobacter mori TaxID=539813 RepID=UPI003D656136
MLKMDLHWLIPAIIIGSDRIMLNGLNQSVSSWDECYRSSVRDYQSYISGRLRKEDIDKALSFWIKDLKSPPDILNILSQLKNKYLFWGGDRFEVNSRDLECWLALLSQVDPAWVIGYGYADLINKGILSVQQVIYLLATQCPNALPKRFDNEPVADNHVHLGGNGHYNLSLASLILYLEKRPKLEQKNWPYRSEHSLFNSNTLSLENLPVMFHFLFEASLGIKNQRCLNDSYNLWEKSSMHSIYPQIDVIRFLSEKNDFNQLLIESGKVEGASSWIMIVTALLLKLISTDSAEQNRYIQGFIQTSSILRNYMVVSGVGLGEFVTYFGFKYRKPLLSSNYKNHSIIHDLNPEYYREFRSGMYTVRDYIREAMFLYSKELHKQIHFVYHFSRSFSKNSTINRYYEFSRKQTHSLIKGFQDFFSSITFSKYPINNNLSSTESFADLRAMVRGFDVAGNENELPIEVFAPALRVIRNATHTHIHPYEKRLRQPFITLHAGEDFPHIISGLRSVDESVTFCDFRPNDRIGHGLALGISPKKWAERQQRSYIPLQEHLDNLVWLYHKGTQIIAKDPRFHSALVTVLEKIKYFCNELHQREYSPLSLYQAWLLRRNCPIKSFSDDNIIDQEIKLWAPDLSFIQKHEQSIISSEACELWRKYLSRTRHDADIDNLITITYQSKKVIDDYRLVPGNLEENISDMELDLIEAVQDSMLEKFSQSQWLLEVCPTSNIYIGRLESYDEHPIFRWNPPKKEALQPGGQFNRFGLRNGPVRVCINTDDAGLMPTTLENEYRIIKDCAKEKFDVSDLDACQWIDNIRRTGVELFKTNHIEWLL